MAKEAYAMVIAPHPDDAEFGIAGTVARWVKEGKDVIYVICTNGDKGTSDLNIKPEQLAKTREREQLAAAKVLGVREVIFLGYPDQSLEDTPDFRKALVRLIRIYKPEVVASCDPYRRYIWHRDHRIAGRVTLDAIFPYARDIYAYQDLLEQGIMPHKVREAWLWGTEDPNFCSDISNTFDMKINALRCHKSQIGWPDLEERLKTRYKAMAKGTCYDLAEAFHRVEIPY